MALDTTIIPDLEITSDGILNPFGFIVDFKQSKLDMLPNVKETTEELIGVDGEYSLSSKYEARLFYIVSYSDIMTVSERDDKIAEIAVALDKLKEEKCLFKYNNKFYAVKLGGKPDCEINPNWITSTISLKANPPHGYSEIKAFNGNGTFIVGGQKPTYPIFEITNCNGATTITINGIDCYLGQALSPTDTVIIDCEYHTATLNGTTNILDKWVEIPPILSIGDNTISISQGTLATYWRDKYISL